jgi:hypothetical protein
VEEVKLLRICIGSTELPFENDTKGELTLEEPLAKSPAASLSKLIVMSARATATAHEAPRREDFQMRGNRFMACRGSDMCAGMSIGEVKSRWVELGEPG